MPSEMSSLLHAANMLIIKLQRRMLEMAKMNRQLHDVLRVLQLQSASNLCEVKMAATVGSSQPLASSRPTSSGTANLRLDSTVTGQLNCYILNS